MHGTRAKFTEQLWLSGLVATLFMTMPARGDVEQQNSRMTADGQRYWVEEITRELTFPSAIAWMPNGDALIAERMGAVRVLRKNILDPRPLAGTPAVYQNVLSGLKDIAVDSDFQRNSIVYLALAEGSSEQYHTAVYKARYAADKLTDVQRIFRARDEYSGIANGSARMLVLADGTLLVAVPENNYYKHKAQRLDSHIGKIVRITRDGTPLPDNPFINTPGALPEIWSYGHRVTTGLYQDKSTGKVWEVEPGPEGGDELNLLKAGGNFGWAQVTWGFDYSGGLAGPQQSAPGIEDPLLVWMRTPRGTPSGLTRYLGNTYPRWNGDFFVGHLTGTRLERLRIEDNATVLQETMLLDLHERIRDVKVGPDNRLYLLTDHQIGRLLRLQPGDPPADQHAAIAQKLEPVQFPADTLSDVDPGDPAKGQEAFTQLCSGCHSVGQVVRGGQIGPDLLEVFGRGAGSQPGFNYSKAMSQLTQTWDRISLNMFLSSPDRYVPGTNMTVAPVTDAAARRNIVTFLQQSAGK